MMKRIWRSLFPRRYTLEDLSKMQINQLRKDGASIGDNVDIINSQIEGGAIAALLTIGDNVTITNSRILLHDASTYKPLGYTKVGEVRIGNNVFIGANSIVLPNVRIGSNVVIGAGSVVAKDIPDNSIAVGNPIRVISTYDEYIERQAKRLSNAICIDKTLFELDTDKDMEELNKLFSSKMGFVK